MNVLGVQGQPWLCIEIEASLGYIKKLSFRKEILVFEFMQYFPLNQGKSWKMSLECLFCVQLQVSKEQDTEVYAILIFHFQGS